MLKIRLWPAVAPLALLTAAAALAQGQPQSFQAHRLQVDSLVAALQIDVDPSATSMSVAVQGEGELVQKVHAQVSGDTLVVSMDGGGGDWWAQMWGMSSSSSDDLRVTIKLPPNTPVKVSDYTGDAVIGDLNADLVFSANDGSAKIGQVTTANISISGAGDVALANVLGRLEASISGSGSVSGQDTKDVAIDIAGNGDISLGAIDGAFDVDVAGSGDVSAKSVKGKVSIDVAGSGDVKIEGGSADPFKVDIAGSGDVRFGGTANNPDVSVMGAGDVWINAYTGTLNSDGADIKIGSQH